MLDPRRHSFSRTPLLHVCPLSCIFIISLFSESWHKYIELLPDFVRQPYLDLTFPSCSIFLNLFVAEFHKRVTPTCYLHFLFSLLSFYFSLLLLLNIKYYKFWCFLNRKLLLSNFFFAAKIQKYNCFCLLPCILIPPGRFFILHVSTWGEYLEVLPFLYNMAPQFLVLGSLVVRFIFGISIGFILLWFCSLSDLLCIGC